MKWSKELATRDFLEGIVFGTVCTTFLVGIILVIIAVMKT